MRIIKVLALIIVSHLFLSASVENMQISFWPEYDHEGVLVIFNGEFSDDQVLPVTLEFDVPADAHNIIGMGMTANPDSTIQLNVEGGTLSVSLLHSRFQVEFYANSFGNQTKHVIDYDINFNFDINNSLKMYVQKPIAAENFTLNFKEDEIQQDRHGLGYYTKDLGAWKKGQNYALKVEYDNKGSRLSIDVLKEMMSQMGGSQPAPAKPETPNNNWLWGLIAIVLISGLGIAVFLKPQTKDIQTAESVSPQKFCAHCGAKREAGHKFCSSCGQQF